jgi:F0F1-type ATP synthase delta subunit
MGLLLLTKVFVLQLIVIFILVVILKKTLNHLLIDSAIRELEFGEAEKTLPPGTGVAVISHKALKLKYKERIVKATQKRFGQSTQVAFKVDKHLWGGAIIAFGKRSIDCSLRDRMNRAFQR